MPITTEEREQVVSELKRFAKDLNVRFATWWARVNTGLSITLTYTYCPSCERAARKGASEIRIRPA